MGTVFEKIKSSNMKLLAFCVFTSSLIASISATDDVAVANVDLDVGVDVDVDLDVDGVLDLDVDLEVAIKVDISFSVLTALDKTFKCYSVDDVVNIDLSVKAELKVIFTNYGSDGNCSWIQKIVEEYQKCGVNVIVINYEKFLPKCVKNKVINFDVLVKLVSELIGGWVKAKKVCMKSIHFIGFSMGGQIAALISRALEKLTGRHLGRITALDYSMPSFTCNSDILNKNDALFVDVYHFSLLCSLNRMGHADIYVNGGQMQSYCSKMELVKCSHLAATFFYVLTIQTDIFAVPCKSYQYFIEGKCDHKKAVVVGERMSKKSRGTFYLTTTTECANQLTIWLSLVLKVSIDL